MNYGFPFDRGSPRGNVGRLRSRGSVWPAVLLLTVALGAPFVSAAEIEDGYRLFRAGSYAECARAAAEAIEAGEADEDWHLLKVRAEVAVGRYSRALATLEAALSKHARRHRAAHRPRAR